MYNVNVLKEDTEYIMCMIYDDKINQKSLRSVSQILGFVYVENNKIQLAEGMMDLLTSCGGTLKFLTLKSIFS